ncbi:Ig-like domain-containing protein [Aeromicrobium stalagmiti]|uniref:Ig-like domain-containing protein n=1 Tax=Aeromicrobium stalagmiti TaxID=2738988 RepID=UPI001567EBE0|nr:Ig-like domain-containing protein [Aeromicrobium stalagmiti]NRQ49871.1 Ig-like domain repeat protein [Aeromicrobium stalagmiti]
MSPFTTRLRSRLLALTAAGALAAGTLAVTTTPAQAAPETIDNATFTWGVSGYAQDGIFGPWTFKDFTGDASYLQGNVATAPVNPTPQTEYVVDPVPATSFPTSKAGKAPNAVKFTGGDGTIDRATGTADLEWSGSYTVNAYPAIYNAPNEIYSDPSLTVDADGSGRLEAEFTIGAGTSMTGEAFPEQSFGRLTIATFDAGSLSAKTPRGYRVTPDYQGVEATIPAGQAQQNRTCTAAEGTTGWWGAWPQELITALSSHVSGQSVLAHFYSTGCGGKQDNKPPLPIDVKFPTDQGEVTISQSVFDNDAEETVTVTGTGFNPALSAGNTQPPFAGKASGLYIAFGRFADPWDPTLTPAPPSSNRGLGDPQTRNGRSVKWAVPSSSFPGAPAQDPSAASYTELAADGSFSTSLTVKKSDITKDSGSWGIYTYRAGNAAVPEYSTFTPISFVDKDTTTVDLDRSAYSGTEGTATPVITDVSVPSGDAAAGEVELEYTADGAGSGDVVDTATLGDNGRATLELPASIEAGEGDLKVTYLGSDSAFGSTSESVPVTIEEAPVEPAETTLSVVGVAASSPYGAARTAKVTVDTEDGAPTPTGSVTAKIGSTTVGTGVLDGAGVATLALSRTTDVGARSVVYSYAGDEANHGSSTTTSLTITAAKVAATRGSTTKPTTRKAGRTTVYLKALTGGVTPYGTVTVTFKKSGQSTRTKTKYVSAGRADVTIPKLAKGTWKVSVKFAGNARFARTATTAAGSFTVTK